MKAHTGLVVSLNHEERLHTARLKRALTPHSISYRRCPAYFNKIRDIPGEISMAKAKESAAVVRTQAGNLLGPKFAVGEKKNYNFQGNDYTFWPFGTIEQIPSERRFRARAMVVAASGDNVVFNSYHEDYADAERAITVVREALTGNGPLYNIFAETIEVHTVDHGGGHIVTVYETLALIWSFNYSSP